MGIQIRKVTKEYAEKEIINSIKSLYKEVRQESKTPTFALTYAGTYHTLIKKCGFDESTAKQIEARYHELYKASDEWVKKHVDQASKDGYVTCAFGLRVRTPILYQVIRGNKATPKEADSEARTVGNALGQSWCLLNSRAGIEFNSLVRKDKELRLKIRPCVQIHDAQYFLIKEEPNVVLWVNHNLVKCAQWQNDPIIAHPDVHLGGNLSIFYPDWAHELELPNDCSKEQLIQLCKSHKESL